MSDHAAWVAKSIPANQVDLSFIEQFRQQAGRRLRVLHIGNIANNAYNNACIQRRYGIEADVLCYNYYHIMGCPEWEDGSFQQSSVGVKLDAFKPDWWSTSLGGWSRPRWFVQGPSALCIDYLRAKNAGWKLAAALKWLQLEFVAWEQARSEQGRVNSTNNLPYRLRLYDWINSSPRRQGISALSLYKLWLGTSVADGILGPESGKRAAGAVAFWLNKISAWVWFAIGRLRRRDIQNNREAIAGVRREVEEFRRTGKVTPQSLTGIVFEPVRTALGRSLSTKAPISNSGLVAPLMLNTADRHEKIERLTNAIREDPVELDASSRSYLEEYIGHPGPFEAILPHYDIIQGYAIDGFIPLMNGVKNFTSYEHGTLREIPFERNLTGLICRFAFQLSPLVFVTNSDVLPSVARLGLEEDRVTYLPHAFDDTKLLKFCTDHPELTAPASGPVLFFSPTRQHWKTGNSSWQKGNDIFIRAAAQMASHHDFKLILVEWGQEVADSASVDR